MNNQRLDNIGDPIYVVSKDTDKLLDLIHYLQRNFNFKEGDPIKPNGQYNDHPGNVGSGSVWINIPNKAYWFGRAGIAYTYPLWGLAVDLDSFKQLFLIVGRSRKLHSHGVGRKRLIVIAESLLCGSSANCVKYGIICWFKRLRENNRDFNDFLLEISKKDNLEPNLKKTLVEGFNGMETVKIVGVLRWCYNMDRSVNDTVENWQYYYDNLPNNKKD